jgi:nucleotide-binding universal stress UspA family protein
MKQYQTILVPTDFSKSSLAALEYALELAASDCRIVLCHVVDDVPLSYGYVGTAALGPDLRRRMAEEAEEEILGYVPKELPPGVQVEHQILHGVPFAAIIKLARDEGAELIVMSTHGRTGIKHALIGSVAEKVVRKAHCPVLVVRPEGQTFEMP